MAKSINQVMLMGRLVRDPEARTTTSGKSIATFSIAVDRPGSSDETDFFEVTVWEKLADIVTEFVFKGQKVLVQGRLQQDRWEKDGKKQSKIGITATDVTFLDTPREQLQPKRDDVVIEDIEEKPIDLSEIPF